MKYLSLPVTAQDDENVVIDLTNEPEWSAYKSRWITAYKNYYTYEGNPFALIPENFGTVIEKRQYKLYDTRRNSGELARMRRRKGLLSCPVCGSPVTGSLDHYLPRTVYPEFSIMRANLVPACSHCNSGAKGKIVPSKKPARFIHPYYDKWADDPLWAVRIKKPFKAARFCPIPFPTLKGRKLKIVKFHLENVFGDQFDLSMDNKWSTYPRVIRSRLNNSSINQKDIESQVKKDLREAKVTNGTNSWYAAFFRGILLDNSALKFIHSEVVVDV